MNAYSCEPKRKLDLKCMEINKKYKIISVKRGFKKPNSKKLVTKIEIEGHYIYLPRRFIELSHELLQEVNNKNYEILNAGKWKNTHKLVFSNSDVDSKANSEEDITNYLNSFGYNPEDSEYNENKPFAKSCETNLIC